MLVCAFVVRTCMLHKALIRLRGCTCLSVLLLYVHVCYIRPSGIAQVVHRSAVEQMVTSTADVTVYAA